MEVKLARKNGTLKIEIDGTMYEPLSFKSFRPTERNITDFYNAGVRLFSILSSGLNSILGVPYSLYGESWLGIDNYDFSVVDKQIDLFIKCAPEGYFALMFQLDTRKWYIEEEDCPDSFTSLSQIAGNSKWRHAAAEYMKAIIRHVEEKYPDRFYGYFLLGGTTTEWFSGRDYFSPHQMKTDDYRKYIGKPDAPVPEKDRICLDKSRVFYDMANDADVIEYVRYHNTIISDAITYFASEAQTVLKHKKLLGVYYGYLFELAGARLWNDGSLGYMKVFDSPDIDMISSPSSYEYRKHIDPSAFMVTFDSLDRRNKLYYLEFDHITHLAPQYIEGHAIPGFDSKLADENQTIDIMRRDFCLTASKGAALWWFDMFEGWFYSDGMKKEIAHMIEISKRLSERKAENISEIAVFADGNSLMYVNKESQINKPLLSAQRKGLAYLGAPYDVYDVADIEKIEADKYKLFIFLDSFELSEQAKEVISQRFKKKGKTILWCYAPGYICENKADVSNISELTDISVCNYSGNDTTAIGYGVEYGFDCRYDAMFFASDGEVLAKYKGDGKTALARKKLKDYTSVYSALGNLPSRVLREIAKDAGVFVYSEDDNPVYVNNLFIGVCSHTDGTLSLNIPKSGQLKNLFDGTVYDVANGRLELKARKGEVKMLEYVSED